MDKSNGKVLDSWEGNVVEPVEVVFTVTVKVDNTTFENSSNDIAEEIVEVLRARYENDGLLSVSVKEA